MYAQAYKPAYKSIGSKASRKSLPTKAPRKALSMKPAIKKKKTTSCSLSEAYEKADLLEQQYQAKMLGQLLCWVF